MAFDAQGKLLGHARATLATSALSVVSGAHPTVAGARVPHSYDVRRCSCPSRWMFTNTVERPIAAPPAEIAIRWSGCSISARARLGLSRDEIRRRNFIRPEQLPYKNRSAW